MNSCAKRNLLLNVYLETLSIKVTISPLKVEFVEELFKFQIYKCTLIKYPAISESENISLTREF